jgi:hypothetical protein
MSTHTYLALAAHYTTTPQQLRNIKSATYPQQTESFGGRDIPKVLSSASALGYIGACIRDKRGGDQPFGVGFWLPDTVQGNFVCIINRK